MFGDGSTEALAWRAALSTGEVGIMRACEFALDDSRGEAFDVTQHLTPADVRIFERDGVVHARLQMRKRKDLKVLRGKHDSVLLAGGGEFIDAPAALVQWMVERRRVGLPVDGPLFCDARGVSFTTSQVRDAVRRCMAAVGLEPLAFGAHSLRIGGATAALAAGVAPAQIRMMGRWSSDVYEIYCRLSEEAALRVGAAIGSARVRPAARAFTHEHLELLPDEIAAVGRAFGGLGDGEDEA